MVAAFLHSTPENGRLAANLYAAERASRFRVAADLVLYAADIVMDMSVLAIFAENPSCWFLSLAAVGLFLNVLNMLLEGVSFGVLAEALRSVHRNEYTPMFLRILLSQALYEAGPLLVVHIYALLHIHGLTPLQAYGLLCSCLLSLRSAAIGRTMCGVDVSGVDGPFDLRAFQMMPGYVLAQALRLTEISFRCTSTLILMKLLHPAVVATLFIDLALVGSARYIETRHLADTVCFITTGAPLLLMCWQGGAVFGCHKLDGRAWYVVTLTRTVLLFACSWFRDGWDGLVLRLRLEQVLVGGLGNLAAEDPSAMCHLLVLVLCACSGLALLSFVLYLACFTSKLRERDMLCELLHRRLRERLRVDFEVAQATRYGGSSAAELPAVNHTMQA